MIKPERTGKTKDYYNFYRTKFKCVVTSRTYFQIISDFNMYCMKEMIENGRVLDLKDNIGKLYIACVWRSFKYKVVNWGETNKRRALGESIVVYFTDAYSLKFIWNKGRFKAKSLVRFIPTRGPKGNLNHMLTYNKDNIFAHKNYSQINKT